MKTKSMFFATILFLMLVTVSQTFAQGRKILPDLTITDVEYVSTNVKQIKVQVKNQGAANAPLSILSLRIYIPASNDSIVVNVPPLAKGKSTWVIVTAMKSLYAQVKFMLRVDAPNAIIESNEGNNNRIEDKRI